MKAVSRRIQMADSRVLVPHLGGRQRETTRGLSSSCFNVNLSVSPSLAVDMNVVLLVCNIKLTNMIYDQRLWEFSLHTTLK